MRTSTKRFLLTVSTVGLMTAGLSAVANAAPDPTTGVELNVDENQFVAGKATFDPGQGRTEGLAAIKELRAYMWEKNPPYRGYDFEYQRYTGRLQDAVRAEGMTKEQYLDVRADENLNWIAIQRAYENGTLFGHDRPNGLDSKTAVRPGVTAPLESVSVGRNNMRNAIVDGLGKGELQALINLGGKFGQDPKSDSHSGHLMHLIHPRHKNFGVGKVYVPGSIYKDHIVVVSSNDALVPDNTPSGQRTTTLYRAPKPGEKPTGIVKDNPGSNQNPGNTQNPGNKDNQPGAGLSSEGSSGLDAGAIVGIAIAIVTVVGGIAGAIMSNM